MQNSTTSDVPSSEEDTNNAPPSSVSEESPQNEEPATDDSQANVEDTESVDEPALNWEDAEFVHHQKSPLWYAQIILVAIIAAVIIYIATKGLVSSAVIIAGAILLCAYGSRPPRQISYQLDRSGLTINQRHFKYEDFRSFSVVPEGESRSIIFTPLKRFAPLTTIYYPPEGEQQIVALLSSILPLAEYKHDAVDQLMHRIRF